MPKAIEVWTTCSSKSEANRIAKLAVSLKLCACAHVIPVDSFYTWDDELHSAKEFRIAFKSTKKRLKALKQLVHAEHSYELPAFYWFEIGGGSDEYLHWIRQSCAH